jgi:hypothetical protein
MTINFANNRLLGTGNVLPEYKTSKARICVTVGMMTTGYDCPDILNLGLFTAVITACICEGMDTGKRIVGALKRLGFHPHHAWIMLEAVTGSEAEPYYWYRDDEGHYRLHDEQPVI